MTRTVRPVLSKNENSVTKMKKEKTDTGKEVNSVEVNKEEGKK